MKKPELLSPAGDMNKLKTVYDYGADAAYIGLYPFSLRKRTDKVDVEKELSSFVKPRGKKLYAALNIFFSQSDIDVLKKSLDRLENLDLDAVIVSDIGAADIIKNRYPSLKLHLSTQASCMNAQAAKIYKKLGFDRIILARECSLDDIKRIKDAQSDLEIETFVHGAMCMAVSGRCILSAALTDRSANKGFCSHPCRWKYRLAIEEEKRPGEYMPINEEDGYTTILSSKDLCMIEHLEDLKNTGVDSFKIEGRMKSIYYAAIVTRAYRKAIDNASDAANYANELLNISHREYTTGFFYGVEKYSFEATKEEYIREYRFLAIVLDEVKDGIYSLDIRYQISSGKEIEYIGPDVLNIKDNNFKVLDENFEEVPHIDHSKIGYLRTSIKLKKGYIVRQDCRT